MAYRMHGAYHREAFEHCYRKTGLCRLTGWERFSAASLWVTNAFFSWCPFLCSSVPWTATNWMLDLESGLGPRFTLMVGDAVWVVCHTASHYEANHVPVSVKLSLITWLRWWPLYCSMWTDKRLVSNQWWVILWHCFKTLCHCVNISLNPQ